MTGSHRGLPSRGGHDRHCLVPVLCSRQKKTPKIRCRRNSKRHKMCHLSKNRGRLLSGHDKSPSPKEKMYRRSRETHSMRRLLQSESGGKNLSAERRWIISDHEKTLPKILNYPQLFLRQGVKVYYTCTWRFKMQLFRYFNIPFSWSVGLSFFHP